MIESYTRNQSTILIEKHKKSDDIKQSLFNQSPNLDSSE